MTTPASSPRRGSLIAAVRLPTEPSVKISTGPMPSIASPAPVTSPPAVLDESLRLARQAEVGADGQPAGALDGVHEFGVARSRHNPLDGGTVMLSEKPGEAAVALLDEAAGRRFGRIVEAGRREGRAAAARRWPETRARTQGRPRAARSSSSAVGCRRTSRAKWS